MALSLRRSSDWSVVLRTDNGQQISFDRENRRVRSSQVQREPAGAGADVDCPVCHRPLPKDGRARQRSAGEAREASFVHPEYFGLLASCLEEENVIEVEDEDEEDDRDGQLHAESFNQGYCERFFVDEGFLGRGGRGEVVKVRHVLEGISLGVFALKRVSVGDCQSLLIKMLREVQSLRFKHPNLVSYNHVWLERTQNSTFGPKVPVLHILQEFCDGGDLESYAFRIFGKLPATADELKARQRRRSKGLMAQPEPIAQLGVDTIYSYFRDILAGLSYLHEQGLIHRDMKSSNCLLDTQTPRESGIARVLVSDFGEAQYASVADQRSGGTGTLSYTAPEILRGQPWTTAADMFSLGMILYFLTHEGNLPYNSTDDDFVGLRQEILDFQGFPLPHGHDHAHREDSRELAIVLSKLLDPNPLNRPSCADLIMLMQLHDQKAPLRPAFRSRNSGSKTHAHEQSASDSKWPPALPPSHAHSLIMASKNSPSSVQETADRSQGTSLVPLPHSRSLAGYELDYVVQHKDERIAIFFISVRVLIVANILDAHANRLNLLSISLVVLLQLVESIVGMSISSRMTITLAFSFALWLFSQYL